eukprot:m.195705 g.195705  ORF g.195705 m.195705 type:complete len:341 (+) comp14896_c0_seq4:190-1212(+)
MSSTFTKSLGSKFGLIKPTGKVNAMFGEDSDEEEEVDGKAEVNASLQRAAILQRQAEKQHLKALEEDETVFQYDEVYDEMAQKRVTEDVRFERQTKTERKSKYVKQLLASASDRKLRDQLRIERQELKNREKEGDEFDDKEQFVTSAYRKKLQELKEQEELERREAAEEAANDVTKQSGLGNFYRNLLSGNVAMGSKETDKATKGKQTSTTPQSVSSVGRSSSADKSLPDGSIAQKVAALATKPDRESGPSQTAKRPPPSQDDYDTTPAPSATVSHTQPSLPQRSSPPPTSSASAAIPTAKKAAVERSIVARQTQQSEVDAARKRALARRKQRKRPVAVD